MKSKDVKKKIQKKRMKAWVSRGSDADNYGFGSNWTLNIGEGNVPKKSMWLGQGGKVTSRMLGIDYSDYVKDVSQRAGAKKQFKNEAEWMSNKKVNKLITGDVLQATMGENPELKKLLKVEDWGLAVQ